MTEQHKEATDVRASIPQVRIIQDLLSLLFNRVRKY